MTATSHDLRLKNPPVRYVRLTVDFKSSLPIQNWHLDQFYGRVADDYPIREEVAPKTPIENENQEILIAGTRGWPIPRTILSRQSKTLEVQEDQLAVTWNFDEDSKDNKYPGFETLLADITNKYGMLEFSLKEFENELEPTRVECLYGNEIEKVTGRDLLLGVLTEWNGKVPEALELEPVEYAGIRIHDMAGGPESPFSSTVFVDTSAHAAPMLGFEVSKLTDQLDIQGDLELVHNHVTSMFLKYVSDEMLNEWR